MLKDMWIFLSTNIDTIEKVSNIVIAFTTLISLFITWKVYHVGQIQFEKNLERTDEQINLIKDERKRTLELGKPIMAVPTSGVSVDFKNNEYKMLFKLQNYGSRPADRVKIDLYTFKKTNANQYVEVGNSYHYTYTNSIVPSTQVDLFHVLQTNVDTKIYVYLLLTYCDDFTNSEIPKSFLYTILEKNSLEDKKETQLWGASLHDKIEIDNILKQRK